jgi:hypothetical protein
MLRLRLSLLVVSSIACIGKGAPEGVSRGALQDSDPGVGLGLYFLNGVYNQDLTAAPDPERPTSLSVVDGPNRFLQEIYIVSAAPTTPADGLSPVLTGGDLATLDWRDLAVAGEDWRVESNGVTWQHQVFYRGARWMEARSKFTVTVLDDNDVPLAQTEARAGRDDTWREHDDFLERRFVARVLSTGCAAEGDCQNPEASHKAEALVQVAKALHPESRTFALPSGAASVELRWSEDPNRSWRVPVDHVAAAGTNYGLGIKLEPVSPPQDGVYLPGQSVSVRMTLVDGQGTPLFAPGAMTSYADAIHRRPAAQGLRLVTFRQQQLYWAYKDLQGEMETFLAGPVHRMTQVAATPLTPYDLFAPEITLAKRQADGWSGKAQATPITPILFACLLGLDPSACDVPASDVFTLTIPDDAENGTYVAGVKARREWMGEPIQTAASIEIQVGSAESTQFPGLPVDPALDNCGSCHQGRASLPVAGHGFLNLNSVGAECLACHTNGYYFEPDAGLVIRLRNLHDASNRLGPPR